jgi:hypothetical protein
MLIMRITRQAWPAAALVISGALLGACGRTSRLSPDQTEPPEKELASIIHTADPRASGQLLSGFYGVEDIARWTKSKFSLELRVPSTPPLSDPALLMRLFIPDDEMARLKSIALSASVNGVALPPQSFTSSGTHIYVQSVPAAALNRSPARVDFALDKWMPPGSFNPNEDRELGVVVDVAALKNTVSPEL